MNLKNTFLFFCLFLINCATEITDTKPINIIQDKNDYVIGESMTIQYDNIDSQNELKISVIDNNMSVIKDYSAINGINNRIYIPRLLDGINDRVDINNLYLKYNVLNKEKVVIKTIYSKLNLNQSISVVSLCSSNNCSGLSGNLIEDIPFKIEIKTFGNLFDIFEYKIFINDKIFYEKVQNTSSYTDFDFLHNIKMPLIEEKNSSYIALIKIRALDSNDPDSFAETVLPIRVVRPIEIKYYGKYELAQTYEPIPVTGCIPGTIASRVEYSESTSETRQNSISIVLGKEFATSNSDIITNTQGDEISLTETNDTITSSESSNSTSNEESITNSSEETNSNSFLYSTTDGENWSWSTNQSTSESNTTEQTTGTNNEINGEVTTTVSGEGSLPFLAKASGSISGTVGASHGWSRANTDSNTNTTSNERGYISGQSQDRTREFGSINEITVGSSLTGSYAFTNTNTSSISQGNSQSSARVWNMSESIESGKVVSVGDTESIDNTIVTSSTSETTFSYSGFIPNSRVGKFFRQTSRYTKNSEIITYDIDGYKTSAGYISMNSWAWAPELVISNSCENLKYSNFLLPVCYIEPCGE